MVSLFLLANFLCSLLSQVVRDISGIADKALINYLLVNDLNASRFLAEYTYNVFGGTLSLTQLQLQPLSILRTDQ